MQKAVTGYTDIVFTKSAALVEYVIVSQVFAGCQIKHSHAKYWTGVS